ncbi:MAG: RNA methyltransferase [Muribaculum sp.]|nr:RNA methyltransferase [Muribaculum sp.]
MIRKIESIHDPGVEVFSSLTEAQLLSREDENGCGIFIAESPKVIRTALQAGYQPLSLLCEARHITGDAADIISRTDVDVFTGEREILSKLTGYTLTRGVLCAMRRRQLPSPDDICRDAGRVAVIDAVCDTTNIGAIFRSAAALGMDAVLLTRQSCDPLNRRSIRVSMGTVFQVPWTWIDDPIADLHRIGFSCAAMALREDSVRLDSPLLQAERKLAVILGTEGDGLSDKVISGADYTVMIPMAHGVDSLNVAAASAVAFYALSAKSAV